MNERWSTLPDARRVLPLAEDARPAWLWSQDGQKLIWSNRAAELFAAKIKKSALKLAPPAVPIKGQINRIMRLGTTGRSSLARIQFLTGERPVSATCSTTPLVWEDSEPVLLITAVDPIADDILALARGEAEPELVQPIEEPLRDEPVPDAAYEHELESWREADAETVCEPAPAMEPDPAADAPEQWSAALAEDEPVAPVIEPVDPVADPFDPVVEPVGAAVEDSQGANRLSSLIDRLVADDALFSPLTEADDVAPAPAADVPEPAPLLFKVTGRGFMPNVVQPAEPVVEEAAVPPPPDAETVERVSRYNFDELSRILTDRVGNQPPATTKTETSTPGALINLGGETLVLNRLPGHPGVSRPTNPFCKPRHHRNGGLRVRRKLAQGRACGDVPLGGWRRPECGTSQSPGAARRYAGARDGAVAVDLLARPPCPDVVGEHDRSANRPRRRGQGFRAKLCRYPRRWFYRRQSRWRRQFRQCPGREPAGGRQGTSRTADCRSCRQ
ncbi:hypothetical protein [Devosia aurantiaca]|uniref:Uncharacterized protein n=1 Tax=Devosia aurantiaca TaxID=2714858 RepID=A0A6M1SKK9_9HYPH|nr:hypothetical protein [Devosia aurantiaca]NGP17344.1 hypothetical protein [Devosia aurantiaca]